MNITPEFWGERADRFTAIELDPREFAARSVSETVVVTAKGKGFSARRKQTASQERQYQLVGSDDARFNFDLESRLAIVACGEPDGSDACARWLDRVVRETLPSPTPTHINGINHLAARLCRRYQREAEIQALLHPTTGATSTTTSTTPAFQDLVTELRAYLAQPGIEDVVFAADIKMDIRTLRAVAGGKPPRKSTVLTRIAGGLKRANLM